MTAVSKIVRAVIRTHEIDESGDASFVAFLTEYDILHPGNVNKSAEEVFVDYLIWANGPNWEEFLKAAKPGDLPTKERY